MTQKVDERSERPGKITDLDLLRCEEDSISDIFLQGKSQMHGILRWRGKDIFERVVVYEEGIITDAWLPGGWRREGQHLEHDEKTQVSFDGGSGKSPDSGMGTSVNAKSQDAHWHSPLEMARKGTASLTVLLSMTESDESRIFGVKDQVSFVSVLMKDSEVKDQVLRWERNTCRHFLEMRERTASLDSVVVYDQKVNEREITDAMALLEMARKGQQSLDSVVVYDQKVTRGVKRPRYPSMGAKLHIEFNRLLLACKSKSLIMPLFRRQSEKCRKRQQRQEVLAQQDPEPNFDLSECELQEVPSGVYAICKVLQKEALFLHCNWLSSLNGGGILSDLFLLRVLDLHNNELKCLPDDIGFLERLQILNLENNKLKKLPENIGKLSNLQNLNVKGNHLRELPSGICNLPVLRLLDVSKNEITRLNQRLAYVRTLETLLLDEDKMQYPAKDVCCKGTEAIMKYLCAVLPPPRGIRSSQSENCIKALPDEAHIMESLQQYQNFMKQKRVESCVLEQQLANENRLHRELAAAAAANKQSLVDAISQDQVRMDKELNQLSQKKEEERKRFLSVLNNVEKQAEDLLSELADVSEKARKTEALLDEIEKKRMQEDDWFTVTWEELHNLRRREVLDGMKQILSEFEIFEDQRRLMESERESRGERALQLEKVAENGQVESMLYHREIGQRTAMRTLEEQDKLQKQAFQALQMARDAKHSRISNQIVLIEAELAQLTVVEIDRKSMRLETEKSEMEEQRENGQADYWLVQYQRLLDRKPQSLIDKESHLEIAVKKLLILAGADDYLPVFARHRITIETFMELGDEDLKKMGVHERGIRKGILKGIKEELAHTSKPKQKEKGITLLPHLSKPKMNETVPPLEPPSACASNSADVPYQMYITARGFNSECVICLDMLSEVIFLPCGHVCSCVICSSPLTQCPMCRTSVDQKVKLTISTPSV
ncbi:hypothetical protein C0Q70_18189 [Pomacea canaliculata]|uniref:RING-type domain-containing protein n=1 Tax=Pomacea canaliculata TaxID=400727 RepID=A0A2T7NMI3_POMCA|nr:hypothetical protein C0Q70_18189 [Pomacea canaliculata]